MKLSILVVMLLSALTPILLARVSSTEAQKHFNAGLEHQEQARLEETITEYDEAIRLNPRDAGANCLEGTSFNAIIEHALSLYIAHPNFERGSVSGISPHAYGKPGDSESCLACSTGSGNLSDSIDTSASRLGEREASGSSLNESGNIGVRNPAAMYCNEMGYEYKIIKTADGEKGICVLPDGKECDAWAFYRGECGEEFSYCAKNDLLVAPKAEKDGFATKCTTCVLPDESRKTVSELLNLGEKCTVGTRKLDASNTSSDDVVGQKDLGGTTASLPDHFDWRDKDGWDWMTPVRNQGLCGSCWAFSAVGVVEPQYNIRYGNPNLDLDLSEQYLVSDCFVLGNCDGGWHYYALLFIRYEGIPDENCFPYVAIDRPCSDRCPDWINRLKKIDETEQVESNIETIKEYLLEKGPLSVAMGFQEDYGGYFDEN
ncbi:MAG: DUF333 domain-containing protein, partial [Chloroflexota bacterium]